MVENTGEVIPISIEDEVKVSYLNYAMSVIISRALPDVRDGLKPVHRRILYSMSEMGLRHDKAYKKCGRIVGDVLGKFHPHGDQSIYDALVRLAQGFSLRYTVVQGQGNFGSVDGDPPAAMRYTEARLAKISEFILKDIKKNTVDFGPNYDESMVEPLVLPTSIPFLLLNGASGIAVGMATNMAPHNLTEVCNGICAMIDDPDIEIDGLLQYIKGPDFPTGAIINGHEGIIQAAKTGRGKITVRARYEFEELKNGKEAIIFNEIPYMVNKANLIIRIADLVRDKKIEGISDIRDESDRTGMRIVLELKRSASPKVILNQLFAHTNLQMNFNVNNLAIVKGRPEVLNLKQLIYHFIEHRKEVITRRTIFDLKKAEERAHILNGLKIALDNIDEVIAIIKQSRSVEKAKEGLMVKFSLSQVQAQAILDMRLQKITSLETEKIVNELNEIMKTIAYLKSLLENESKIYELIKEETIEIKTKFGDERKTAIVFDEVGSMKVEDLIEKEDMVVLISKRGYIKRIPFTAYKEQGRGGKGSSSTKLKDGDYIEQLFIASTHDYIMFITNMGKSYWLKVHEIPEGSRNSKGRHLKTILEFEEGEEITTNISLNDFSEDSYIFMTTKMGTVKRVQTSLFKNAKTRGIKALLLDENDFLISALLTQGNSEMVFVTKNGLSLKINEEKVRAMGRSARGVRGIRLKEEDEVISVVKCEENTTMFLMSKKGYGKRIEFTMFNEHGRGTGGQIGYKINDKSGKLISATNVTNDEKILCITGSGKTIKLSCDKVPILGKNAFGVRIVNIKEDDFVVDIANSEDNSEDEEE